MSLYPENTPYCLYRHLKPCGEVFYIGIGSTFRRPYEKITRSKFWKRVVKKYPNYEVQILTTNLSKEDACEIEKILISYYGRRDLVNGTLVNLTDGGESTYGRVMEDWQKQSISDFAKTRIGELNPNYGNKWDEGAKSKMSKLKKEQYKSGELKVNYEAIRKGIKSRNDAWESNPELKRKMAKRVSKEKSKYDYLKIDIITGDILEEFESFMELKKTYPKVGKTVVNSVCNGHKGSYRGFIWRYRCKYSDEIIVPKLKSHKGFEIYYEVEDKRYLKLTQAAKGEKLNYSTIYYRFESDNYPSYKIKEINNPYL